MATLRVEVVTAERTVLEDDAEVVVAPGIEGQLGILPRHSPLLTALAEGEVVLKVGGDEKLNLAVLGGFLEVRDNKVTILADAAERADDIDVPRAEAAMQRAQERIRNREADLDLERAVTALRRANVRIKIARRRRGVGVPVPPPPSAGQPG